MPATASNPESPGSGGAWVIAFGISALLLTIAAIAPDEVFGLMICPFWELTGLPCPTCGMTTAFRRLVDLDLLGAVRASPLGAGLALAAVAVVLVYPLRRVLGGGPKWRLGRSALRWLAWLGGAAVLVNWVWLIARGAGAH